MRKIIAMAVFSMSMSLYALIPVQLRVCTGPFVTEHKVKSTDTSTISQQDLTVFILATENSDSAVMEVRDASGDVVGTGAVRGKNVVFLPQGFTLVGSIADFDTTDAVRVDLSGETNGESLSVTGRMQCQEEMPMEIVPR